MQAEIRAYVRCREALEEWGVNDTDCTMVLFGMCDGDVGYREALTAYAEHRVCPVEIMHSRLCYALLAAHVDVSPHTLFQFLKWRGEQIDEN